jgi:hypothetical protein
MGFALSYQSGENYTYYSSQFLSNLISGCIITNWNPSAAKKMLKNLKAKQSTLIILALAGLFGCAPQSATSTVEVMHATVSPSSTVTPGEQPALPSIGETPTATSSPNPELEGEISIWFSPEVPASMSSFFNEQGIEITRLQEDSVLALTPASMVGDEESTYLTSDWVYCLVAPFPTVMDGVSWGDILQIWKGREGNQFSGTPLLLSASTKAAFEQKWGAVSGSQVVVLEDDEILERAWQESSAFALIPFEDLGPRWKVLRVNGISPLEKGLDLSDYPLTIPFSISGLPGVSLLIQDTLADFPQTNRDENKMTIVAMTGTTAMVRYTALRMEENGILYPAEAIKDILLSADITHISNEVPFYDLCPPAEPVRVEQRFCSDPSYIGLLREVGADVIELTGNHILDWGYEPFLFTLDLYDEQGYLYYGGGRNKEDAIQPLLMEDHGNKLAFLGCSPAGPESVWATLSTPGSAPCNYEFIQATIQDLTQAGYIPIFTFQHFEVEQFPPHSSQRVDFQAVAAMGAQIVSGSQSHYPQAMTFVDDHFIHYGLGNLFFDQMYGYNPHEFIDLHVFYDGKYINTVLFTAMLEDYSRPRPMNIQERDEFLEDIFDACTWE